MRQDSSPDIESTFDHLEGVNDYGNQKNFQEESSQEGRYSQAQHRRRKEACQA
jgi:hypothetical protein